jgi:hypothetical protein
MWRKRGLWRRPLQPPGRLRIAVFEQRNRHPACLLQHLVCLYDGRPVPKVIDFGLAKAMHHAPMPRYRLRTLLILVAILPPLSAVLWLAMEADWHPQPPEAFSTQFGTRYRSVKCRWSR